MAHAFFNQYPELQAHFEDVDTFNAHAKEIKDALTKFLLETHTQPSPVTFDMNEMISAYARYYSVDGQNKRSIMSSAHARYYSVDGQNKISIMSRAYINIASYDPKLADNMLSHLSYEAAIEDLAWPKNRELLWTIYLRIVNNRKREQGNPAISMDDLKKRGEISAKIIVDINSSYIPYFNARKDATDEDMELVKKTANLMILGRQHLQHHTLFKALCSGDSKIPFTKLMNGESLTVDEIAKLSYPLNEMKPIPTFNQYILSLASPEDIQKQNLNTSYLYARYIQWLITEYHEDVAVQDLLAQIKVISAFVQQALRDSSVSLSVLLTEDKTLKNFKASNKAFNAPINTFIEKVSAFDHRYNQVRPVALIVSALMAAAVCIGAAFAPELAMAGAISLWIIGASIGVLSLACFKAFVSTHMRVTAQRREKDSALTTITDTVASYVDESPSTKDAIRATLSATTPDLMINSNIFDRNTHEFIDEYEGLTPYIVELNRIAPKLG